MIDFIFIAIIGAAFIAYAIKRAFFTSFHDKCYEEMESRGHAVFGMCSGQMGGDYETEYLSYSCLDCPPGMIHCKDAKTIKEERASAMEHDRRLYHHLVMDQKSAKVKERFYRKPYGKLSERFDTGDGRYGM